MTKGAAFGTDLAPGGLSNLIGVRPGKCFSYEGPAMPGMTYMILCFTTTHEAIKQVVLPWPLEPAPDLPPTCIVSFGVNPNNRGIDGRTVGYSMVMFSAIAQYKGTRGIAGFEYIDGINGDKTVPGDLLTAWGIYFGMLKKLADIRVIPDGDELVVTCDRRGVRLVTLRFRFKEEIPAEQSPLLGAIDKALTVREIPSVDFKGYVDRSVCVVDTGVQVPNKIWAAEGSIELGHLELDPLDALKVVKLGPAFIYTIDVPKETFSEMYVLEKLPLKP